MIRLVSVTVKGATPGAVPRVINVSGDNSALVFARKMPKPAHFGRKQNSAKGKVFSHMYLWQIERGSRKWWSLRTLYLNTGVNLNYLQQRLPLWVRWRHLKQREADGGYRLAEKGCRFVEVLLAEAPDQCQEYMKIAAEFRDMIDQMDPPASHYGSLRSLVKAVNLLEEDIEDAI